MSPLEPKRPSQVRHSDRADDKSTGKSTRGCQAGVRASPHRCLISHSDIHARLWAKNGEILGSGQLTHSRAVAGCANPSRSVRYHFCTRNIAATGLAAECFLCQSWRRESSPVSFLFEFLSLFSFYARPKVALACLVSASWEIGRI